ncbi:MAG TPA: sulfotransferase [Steroidobacteraceae bacterium]|jgi:hypothetical protein|nr:sulfotransferase [Steroidobacteraceae bacterium]
MSSVKLPNFFIVGAPKAGTTSLYDYLAQHPQVFMCPLKEPNYFASEFRLENFTGEGRAKMTRAMGTLAAYLQGDRRERRFGGLVANWDDYVSLFKEVSNELAIGEATPVYLWSPTAPHNIAMRIPNAKIIVILRNPVDRAYSQYLHMVTVGYTRKSFKQEIQESMAPRPINATPSWPLLEFGRYWEQIHRYCNAFPRSQIHIALYEDLANAPGLLLEDLFSFLGVDSAFTPSLSRHHLQPIVPKLGATSYYLKKWRVWPYLRKLAPQPLGPRLHKLLVRSRDSLMMESDDRAFVTNYYREDIEKLAGLLGRDLSAWLASAAPSK